MQKQTNSNEIKPKKCNYSVGTAILNPQKAKKEVSDRIAHDEMVLPENATPRSAGFVVVFLSC